MRKIGAAALSLMGLAACASEPERLYLIGRLERAPQAIFNHRDHYEVDVEIGMIDAIYGGKLSPETPRYNTFTLNVGPSVPPMQKGDCLWFRLGIDGHDVHKGTDGIIIDYSPTDPLDWRNPQGELENITTQDSGKCHLE